MLRKKLAAQRTEDFRNGFPKPGGGVPDELPADAPQFFKDYHAYYKTPRGYHSRSLNSNQGRNATEAIPFINFPLMSRADEIENAVLVIHGEKAHSRYFGEDAFKKLKGDNKELMIIPGASHTDLYDNLQAIPFDKIEAFLDDTFSEFTNRYGDSVDAEFSSRWVYPEEEIKKLVESLEDKDKVYIKILTYEFEDEYVSFRIFSQGEWKVKLVTE
mgnify:CR=1 FL=1